MCGTKGERHFISSSNTPHKGIKDLPGISLATSITEETSLVALEVSLVGNISHFTYFFEINERSDLVDKNVSKNKWLSAENILLQIC